MTKHVTEKLKYVLAKVEKHCGKRRKNTSYLNASIDKLVKTQDFVGKGKTFTCLPWKFLIYFIKVWNFILINFMKKKKISRTRILLQGAHH